GSNNSATKIMHNRAQRRIEHHHLPGFALFGRWYRVLSRLRQAILAIQGRARKVSALGKKQRCAAQEAMSALPPKADMCGATRDVRFGPKADLMCFSPRNSAAPRRLDCGDVDFFMPIIASNARFASSPPAAIASVRTRGVICQEIPHLSLHQPQALSWPPLPTMAFQYRSVSC